MRGAWTRFPSCGLTLPKELMWLTVLPSEQDCPTLTPSMQPGNCTENGRRRPGNAHLAGSTARERLSSGPAGSAQGGESGRDDACAALGQSAKAPPGAARPAGAAAHTEHRWRPPHSPGATGHTWPCGTSSLLSRSIMGMGCIPSFFISSP